MDNMESYGGPLSPQLVARMRGLGIEPVLPGCYGMVPPDFHKRVSGAKPNGTVDGSPVVAGNFFFGYEQPIAQNTVDSNGVVRCRFLRNTVLKPGETLNQSCVIGAVHAGQLRRDFPDYVERERAHPYRSILHYNSWHDISWGDRKHDAAQCLNVINQIGREPASRHLMHSTFVMS